MPSGPGWEAGGASGLGPSPSMSADTDFRAGLRKQMDTAPTSKTALAMKGPGSNSSYRATPMTGGAKKLRPASDIISPAIVPCSEARTANDDPAVKPGRAKPSPIDTIA